MLAVVNQLPRLGKRELLFTCNYVVSVWRGFLFLWVLGMGYVILLWHSLSLPYNYFTNRTKENIHAPVVIVSDILLPVLHILYALMSFPQKVVSKYYLLLSDQNGL